MDHYKTLGIARTATQQEIQKAYHALALKYHPDANPNNAEAAEKIKEVNKAYQVLRRESSRQEYDATLGGGQAKAPPKTSAGSAPARPSASSPSSPSTAYTTGNPMADILGGMRNAARDNLNGQAKVGADGEEKADGTPTVEIKLTQREAVTGATKTIRVNGRLLRIKISISN